MVRRGPGVSGADLRAARKAAGLTQAQLAALTGFDRGAVWYWERKAVVSLREVAPKRFAAALGLPMLDYAAPNARAKSWGLSGASVTNTPARGAWGLSDDPAQARLDALVAADLDRLDHKAAQRRAKARMTCGAKTRAGHPCRHLSEPGKRRCKWHGGKSTGPKTPEGKARIAEAQRRRWRAVSSLAKPANDPASHKTKNEQHQRDTSRCKESVSCLLVAPPL